MQNSACNTQYNVIEVALVDGSKLVVEFENRGDRLGHTIWLVDAGGTKVGLLQSIEGSPQDAWPPSPPLQSLSIETLTDGRRVALLVGMAGGSHWSASVEGLVGKGELAFDMACRHAAGAGWLGSKYRVLSDMSHNLSIAGDVDVRAEAGEISVHPVGINDKAGTTRWRYILRLILSTEY